MRTTDEFNAIDAVEVADVAHLPAQPSEDKDLGIVPPDHPAVAAETSDTELKHSVCAQTVRVPQVAVDALKNGGNLYCPVCRSNFSSESWSFGESGRGVNA